MLTSLQPDIEKAVRYHTGSLSPVSMGKARRETLAAMQRYDPAKGANPRTYLNSHLQGMQRWHQSRVNGVRIPARAAQHSRLIEQANRELSDTLGRDPSTSELAQHTNLTIDAVTNIRRFGRPTPGSSESQQEGSNPLVAEDQALMPKDNKAWLEMVYDDLDEKDRLIMEYSLGMFGQKKLSTSEIAKRIGASSSAVSQRRAKVQKYIDRALEVNPL